MLRTWAMKPARPVLVVDLSDQSIFKYAEKYAEKIGDPIERLPHSWLWQAIERAEELLREELA